MKRHSIEMNTDPQCKALKQLSLHHSLTGSRNWIEIFIFCSYVS